MDQTKLAEGSGHKSIGHSSASPPKKADRKKAEPARPVRKERGSKSKSDKLVCRYCGSHDLAPSFIKRRDRRCRKCFSKRYGSAARCEEGEDQEIVRSKLWEEGRLERVRPFFRLELFII